MMRLTRPDLTTASALCLMLASCDRAPRPAADAPPAPSRAWNWLDFPRADRLALVQTSAVVEPARIEWLRAPHDGWFELDAGLPGAEKGADIPVADGRIIGRMAPGAESLDAEGEALRLQLADVEDQLRKMREEEAAESFLEQERKVRQDIKNYEAALALIGDPALQRDLLPQVEQASREEIKRLGDRLQAARERLQKNREAGQKQADLQKRQAELTAAKAAFERGQKTERDRFKAPFAGVLRFAVPFEKMPEPEPEKGAPAAPKNAVWRAYVRADALVGALRDHSAFWAKVEMADASLLSVPADDLLFSFASGPQMVEAVFGGRAPEGGGQRPAPVYQFGIENPSPDIARLAGGVVSGKLIQKLPQTAYIVPKVRLFLHRSDAFADGAWERGCARVFPGCRVLAVSRDELALIPPETSPQGGAALPAPAGGTPSAAGGGR